MKTNLEITQNKELKVSVDLSQENEGSEIAKDNAWVSKIQIFNTRSYLDGKPVYESEYDKDFPSVFVITESEMNAYAEAVYGNQCYQTNIFNDMIVVRLEFEYSVEYEADHDCGELVRNKTMALYYPCPIYGLAVNKISGCDCDNVCEDNLPYGFMYELLKKKAVDVNIMSGNIDLACRYFMKFYIKNPCTCVPPCGCEGSNGAIMQTKKCGCNGNS